MTTDTNDKTMGSGYLVDQIVMLRAELRRVTIENRKLKSRLKRLQPKLLVDDILQGKNSATEI